MNKANIRKLFVKRKEPKEKDRLRIKILILLLLRYTYFVTVPVKDCVKLLVISDISKFFIRNLSK